MNEDLVGAVPTTYEWRAIVLPTKIRLISETWWNHLHAVHPKNDALGLLLSDVLTRHGYFTSRQTTSISYPVGNENTDDIKMEMKKIKNNNQ